MGLPVRDITNAIHSLLASRGYYDRVSMHEPKNAPGNGITAAAWFDNMVPIQSSGLNVTSVLAAWNIRLQTNMIAEPQDEIDPNLLEALEDTLDAINGDFDLGIDQIRSVDLLGAHGQPLTSSAGYVNQDKTLYRAILITLPLIVNDCWEQVR